MDRFWMMIVMTITPVAYKFISIWGPEISLTKRHKEDRLVITTVQCLTLIHLLVLWIEIVYL